MSARTAIPDRFEIEAILVRKDAMHKIGTNDDIDPDLDAAFVAEVRPTEAEARKCAEQLYEKYAERLMWNCVTIQKQTFGDDDGNPVWESIGEMKAYHGDRWED